MIVDGNVESGTDLTTWRDPQQGQQPQIDPQQQKAAQDIINEVIANPEKLKDEAFNQKARSARKILGQ